RRLPDGIVLPSYGVAIVLLALSTLVGHDLWPIVRATIGMAALYTFYLLLWLIRPDGMGGGDVKLAGLLGWYLAWLGWGPLVVGAFTGFLWGGIFGVALLHIGEHTTTVTIVQDGVPRFVRTLPAEIPASAPVVIENEWIGAAVDDGATRAELRAGRTAVLAPADETPDLVQRVRSTLQFYAARSGAAPVGRLQVPIAITGAAKDAAQAASFLDALRAWHAGLSSRQAVAQYLGQERARGQSSRAVLGRIRRRLAALARERGRPALRHPLRRRHLEQRGQIVAAALACQRGKPAANATEHGARGLAARPLLPQVLRHGLSGAQAGMPGAQRVEERRRLGGILRCHRDRDRHLQSTDRRRGGARRRCRGG
ncbi:A24 family peptidase, partial [Ralstonia pickettii]|uniref:prepilin peptidase n=1 Tax=Ralstonia pickettii TaxID=329 RepID=UPI001C669A49